MSKFLRKGGRFLMWALIALLVIVAGLLAYRAWRVHENREVLAIDTARGIDEQRFVKIGGIDQYLLLRGEDRNNPVILMLHGGPGLATSPLYAWFRPWEKHFTVVQWDQRGAGKTYGRMEGATPDMTMPRMVADGIEVAQYLNDRFHRKVILLGHSWGSTIGLQMVARRPDLFEAYVGTGQNIDATEGEAANYRNLMAQARAKGDAETIRLLEKIGPPPYVKSADMMAVRGAAAPYGPAAEQPMAYMRRSTPAALFAPGYSLGDILDNIRGATSSVEKLNDAVYAFDANKLGTKFSVPVYFLQGELDNVTPTSLVAGYEAKITAPDKRLVILKGVGHGALLTDPDAFLSALLQLPLVGTKRAIAARLPA